MSLSSASLNPAEVSELIKKRIEKFEIVSQARTEGPIVSLADGVMRIHGLADVMQGEMLEFDSNTYGIALNLERDSVGAVVLGEYTHLAEGQTVKCTGRILEVPVGEGLLGRVVNALGHPIDGRGAREQRVPPYRTHRTWCYCASIRKPTGTNWLKSYRCDDACGSWST